MPSIFYREAYQVATGWASLFTPFMTCEQLEARDWLTSEQGRAAVFADWRLTRQAGHQALRQNHNLLIGQGPQPAN